MIPIWQAVAIAILTGGVGTLVGVIVMSAMIVAARADAALAAQTAQDGAQ
jgi:hypothetical protein